MVDKELFYEARDRMTAKAQGINGIGTLGEKSVHATLKYYFAPDEKYHEIKIGDFVADVCVEGEITEIQTRHFYTMKNKIAYYLKEGYEVTIVYPVKEKNTIVWIDPSTGETRAGRPVRNKHKVNRIFEEVYGLRDFLDNANLHFVLVTLETEDFRLLDGYGKDRKIRATKTDIYPTQIIDEIHIDCIKDFSLLVPESLPQSFDTKLFAKKMGLGAGEVNMALRVLTLAGILSVEKEGRKNVYTRT